MRKLLTLLCSCAASLCLAQTSAATPSQQGLVELDVVRVDSIRDYFTGSFRGARFDLNPDVYLSCSVAASKGGAGTTVTATCSARDADGNRAFCSSQNPEFIRAVTALNINSALTIEHGINAPITQCSRISVFSGSLFID